MRMLTRLAVNWIKSRSRAEQLSIVSDIVGCDYGMVVAPNDRAWHAEWPEGAANAFVSHARIGVNHNYSPPRTEFGPA